MAYSIRKVDVWAAEIDDRPGGLADKLEALTRTGASLEFIIARRAPDKPGRGVVFLTPVKTAKQKQAATDAGFSTTSSLQSVRVEGPDKPGLGSKMTLALGEAGINLRGLSAAALGKKSVTYLAFDGAEDAANAIQILKKALK
jgi:hypothetical protein